MPRILMSLGEAHLQYYPLPMNTATALNTVQKIPLFLKGPLTMMSTLFVDPFSTGGDDCDVTVQSNESQEISKLRYFTKHFPTSITRTP